MTFLYSWKVAFVPGLSVLTLCVVVRHSHPCEFHTAFTHLFYSPITILEVVYSCPLSLWMTLYLQLKKLSSDRHPSINVQCSAIIVGKVRHFGVTMATVPIAQKSTFFVYTSNSEVIHFCLSCTIAWQADPQSSYSWHGDYRIIVWRVSKLIVLELSEIYQYSYVFMLLAICNINQDRFKRNLITDYLFDYQVSSGSLYFIYFLFKKHTITQKILRCCSPMLGQNVSWIFPHLTLLWITTTQRFLECDYHRTQKSVFFCSVFRCFLHCGDNKALI